MTVPAAVPAEADSKPSLLRFAGLIALLAAIAVWTIAIARAFATDRRTDLDFKQYVILTLGSCLAVLCLAPAPLTLFGGAIERRLFPGPSRPGGPARPLRGVSIVVLTGAAAIAAGFVPFYVPMSVTAFYLYTAVVMVAPLVAVVVAQRTDRVDALLAPDLRRRGIDYAIAFGALCVAFALSLSIRFVAPEGQIEPGLIWATRPLHFPVVLLVAFGAGFIEELVFRGYLLSRLHAWTGSRMQAVLVSSVLFGAIHVWSGPVHMLYAGLFGFVLGLVVVWRRSLFAAIVAHTWVDIIAAGATGNEIVGL